MVRYSSFLSLLFLVLTSYPAFGQENHYFKESDQFLKQYVTDGLVKYEAISANNDRLERLTKLIGNAEKPSRPKARKAFYINAYNILAIQQVVNHYPVESPKAIDGFFDGITHKVHGQSVTIDELENQLLFEEFPDARLHFALICAAKGCPPMKAGAFKPDKLDKQLREQAQKALSDPNFIRFNSEERIAEASQILNWYRNDFLEEANSLISYMNQYRKKALPSDTRLRFYDYDWSLNEKGATRTNNTPDSGAGGRNLIRQSAGYILDKGGLEVILFNNLYTQDKYFTSSGESVSLDDRTTFYSGIVEALYGVGGRVNLGFDAFYEGVRNGTAPLKTLRFEKSTMAHHAYTGIMPKVKIAPLGNFQALTVESGLLIPTAEDPEANHHDRPFLANDDVEWWNEFFYVNNLSPRFQLFIEASAIWRMDEEGAFSDQSALRTPARVFFSWFPADKWSLYGMGAYNPTWSMDDLSSTFYQNGLGVKYQLTNTLEIEGLYTNFLLGKNSGAGQTFNIGFRFQR